MGHNQEPIMKTPETVSKRNPRGSLPSGTTPKDRGRQKLCNVLQLIYQWHVTAAPLVQQFLGTTESTYLTELEKKGLVKHLKAPTLLCGRAYMLTSEGVNAAATELGAELPYSVHPSSVSHSLLKHDLAVQRYGILAQRAGHRVTSGRFLSAEKKGKIPDALVYPMGTDQTYALELELSGKWNAELEQTLNSHLASLTDGRWQKVLYVSNSEVLLQRYAERLNSPIHDWWQSVRPDGMLRWTRGLPRLVTDGERAAFAWQHMPALLKGFEQTRS